MRGETFLDREAMRSVYELMDELDLGEAVQDRLLASFREHLERVLSCPLELRYDRHAYRLNDNYRTILPVREDSFSIHAYFDLPVWDAHLYLATRERAAAEGLLSLLANPLESGFRFRTTPLGSSPYTFMVDLDAHPDQRELLVPSLRRDTLRYLQEPRSLEELFDVVNTEGLPGYLQERL